MATTCYLNALGILCAAGSSVEGVAATLQTNNSPLQLSADFHKGSPTPLGLCTSELPEQPLDGAQWNTRNNRLALAAIEQIEPQVKEAIERYGASRVGVIIGTSTASMDESEQGIRYWLENDKLPASHSSSFQKMGSTAEFVARYLETGGPSYAISTACSSGAKALASARRLIRAGICDAVVAGGVDTLCRLTVQGFMSLEAVSYERCNPFSRNRKGINIGEGAGIFLMSKEPIGVELCGVGESSDAHHISAPDPSGAGAVRCMEAALADAGIAAEKVDYINLHGTATVLNDQMEARAVNHVFGDTTFCSSTKPYTGHTLGAAGSVEAGICWITLTESNAKLPRQLWDGEYDTDLPPINLVSKDAKRPNSVNHIISNSFAFGGNNISLLFSRLSQR